MAISVAQPSHGLSAVIITLYWFGSSLLIDLPSKTLHIYIPLYLCGES